MDANLIALLALGYLWWKGKHKPASNAPAPKSAPDAPVPSDKPGRFVTSYHHTTGLHGEPGTVYVYSNGDEWFAPDDGKLAPYFIPGGSHDIQGDESEDDE